MRIGIVLATLQAYTIVVVLHHPELMLHGVLFNTMLGVFYEH